MDQLLALLWLRWRLVCNTLRRHGTLNYVVAICFLLAGLLCALFGVVAGVAGGCLGLPHASPVTVLLVWDGVAGAFLFLWMVGLISKIQQSEIIDLRHLLHLPVSLREAFLLNYLSSLFAPSAISGWRRRNWPGKISGYCPRPASPPPAPTTRNFSKPIWKRPCVSSG